MRLFGLIGYPLGHSFSAGYFAKKFADAGIKDCEYRAFPIASIKQLPDLLGQHPNLQGLNITIPYKQQVIPYLHQQKLPARVQACNCLKIENGRLTGFNTDVVGFEQSFAPQLKPWHTQALVLGLGGATQAVLHVLHKLGINASIVSRSLKQGVRFTYQQLTPAVIQQHTVIINCTPLGTFPNVDSCPPLPYTAITSRHYLYDLVYNPPETLFLKQGAAAGALIQNGYPMLVGQAEESWRIWNTP